MPGPQHLVSGIDDRIRKIIREELGKLKISGVSGGGYSITPTGTGGVPVHNHDINTLTGLDAFELPVTQLLFDANMDADGTRIVNVADPIDDQDAATKKYHDDNTAPPVGGDFVDDFNRTTTPDDVGNGWSNDLVGSNASIFCNGTHLELAPDTTIDGDTAAWIDRPGPGPWGTDGTSDFDLQIPIQVTDWVGDGAYFYVGLGSTFSSIAAGFERQMGASSGWQVWVYGTATDAFGVEAGDLDSSAEYQLRWQHLPSLNTSRVKLWKTSDAEPGTWHATRDPSGDSAADTDELDLQFGSVTAVLDSISVSAL